MSSWFLTCRLLVGVIQVLTRPPSIMHHVPKLCFTFLAGYCINITWLFVWTFLRGWISVANLIWNSAMRLFTMTFSAKIVRILLSRDLPLSVLLSFWLCLILKVFWKTLRQIECITMYVETYEYLLYLLQIRPNFLGFKQF